MSAHQPTATVSAARASWMHLLILGEWLPEQRLRCERALWLQGPHQ